MILGRESGFMFLIPVLDHPTAEKCTDTFDIQITSIYGYLYYIVLIETLSLCHPISRFAMQERE